MAYHPRIETGEYAGFSTSRLRHSELWFINNKPLESAVLGYLAKYQQVYGGVLYAFALEGSHYHELSNFSLLNRSPYMRVFNSQIAKALPRYCPQHLGGSVYERRPDVAFTPADEDIEEKFFYTVLQCVQDGLCERISDYPGYNCFHDAVWGKTRRCEYIRWEDYNRAKRRNKNVSIAEFTDYYELKYERLPGYEHLTQKEYARLMNEKLEKRRARIVNARKAAGKGFVGRTALMALKPGKRAKNPKKSQRNSHRPRILSKDPGRRKDGLAWYFDKYRRYKKASKKFRLGEVEVEFPCGMYRPNLTAAISLIPPPGT